MSSIQLDPHTLVPDYAYDYIRSCLAGHISDNVVPLVLSHLFLLERRFLRPHPFEGRLVEELDLRKPCKPYDYSKLSVSIQGLNFAIIHKIDVIYECIIKYAKCAELNRPTQNRKLTPSHIAVMATNYTAMQMLITAHADLNAKDFKGWAPLHHAALADNETMINLLLRGGADPTSKTNNGLTYKELVAYFQPKYDLENVSIPLFWRGRQLTCQSFTKLTGARFLNENEISQDLLSSFWQNRKQKQEFAFLDLDQVSNSNPKTFIIKEMPIVGLGLFADSFHPVGTYLGEYLGQITEKARESSYTLETCDASLSGNAFRLVNDGFPNLLIFPIKDNRDQNVRRVCYSASDIACDEEICWNYGTHGVKYRSYVERRPHETRKFITELKKSPTETLFEVGAVRIFNEAVIHEKLSYILSTPSVIFSMAFEGILAPATIKELHDLAIITKCIPEDAPKKVFSSLGQIAIESREMRKKLVAFLPKTAAEYIKYFGTLNQRIGISYVLSLIEQTNKFLKRKLSLIKEIDQTKPDDTFDDFFLKLWQEEIYPQSERAIYEIIQSTKKW